MEIEITRETGKVVTLKPGEGALRAAEVQRARVLPIRNVGTYETPVPTPSMDLTASRGKFFDHWPLDSRDKGSLSYERLKIRVTHEGKLINQVNTGQFLSVNEEEVVMRFWYENDS
jgi:hypothetical protein